MTGTTRACANCGHQFDPGGRPVGLFCSKKCYQLHRDRQPATRAADRARHASRYQNDPRAREAAIERAKTRYRNRTLGIASCGLLGCTRDHRTPGECNGRRPGVQDIDGREDA